MNTEGKPLSKEEILDYIVKDWATPPTRQDCYQAMDEYAEIEAIGFAEWKDKYFKKSYDGFLLTAYELVKTIDGLLYGKSYNYKELYQLYKKQQP